MVAAAYLAGHTTDPLVQVGPQYAGHTLVLDLFDIADGPASQVTGGNPFGTTGLLPCNQAT